MKRTLTLATLTLCLTACGTVTQLHTNLDTLHGSFAAFMAGKISAGDLKLADAQNAKAIYDAHFAATGNAFDKADSDCMAKVIDFHPTLMALFGPATPPPQGAPVTGFLSSIAAGSVAAEDTQASIAAKEAIIRKGLPPELEIACAPWWMQFTGARALSHGGAK